jgi:hypothetical protein
MEKKKRNNRKKTKRKPRISKKNLNIEKSLVENFVSLQKVMTNMAIKFDSLSNQISKLLELFEISAKSLAEKGYSMEDKKVAEKMDNLLEQNKIIAKGIALLHEKEIQEIQGIPKFPQPSPQPQRPMEIRREFPKPQTPIQGSPRIKEMGV